jgi:hypothetical protein
LFVLKVEGVPVEVQVEVEEAVEEAVEVEVAKVGGVKLPQ